MKPERQRIAIAEECGISHIDMRMVELLPDYLNDLNAMNDVEKVLFERNDWSACRYEEALVKATFYWAWRATAAQRAEAFLRTLNKWEEEP